MRCIGLVINREVEMSDFVYNRYTISNYLVQDYKSFSNSLKEKQEIMQK